MIKAVQKSYPSENESVVHILRQILPEKQVSGRYSVGLGDLRDNASEVSSDAQIYHQQVPLRDAIGVTGATTWN